MELKFASFEKIHTSKSEVLYNMTLEIKGPSRMTMLLAPRNRNISFELWGLNNVHMTPPDQNLQQGQRPHYFLQFIQGINPRYAL